MESSKIVLMDFRVVRTLRPLTPPFINADSSNKGVLFPPCSDLLDYAGWLFLVVHQNSDENDWTCLREREAVQLLRRF